MLSRFYASLVPVRVECPRCRQLISFGAYGRYQRHRKAYDAITGTLQCPACQHAYQVGIVLWDAPRAVNRAIPDDLRPSRHVLAQLRAQAYGFWPLRKRKPSEPMNVYIGTECICPPLPWRAECPVHAGWGEEQTEEDTKHQPVELSDPETEPEP